MISIIAALDANTRAIGKEGNLLFSLSEDLKRFRKLTTNHPVIMGRKTWESLPAQFRPLPNRTNIIVTRQSSYDADAIVVENMKDAFEAAANTSGHEEVFIIGGGEIYKEGLPFADRLYLTLVYGDVDGDTYFPEYESLFTKEIEREEHLENTPPYTFITLEK